MKKQWYVIHTYSGQENKVKEAIENLIANSQLKDYFGQIIIPSQKTFVIRDGKRLLRERKVFPGYILIEMVMMPETQSFVLHQPGVTKFLGGSKTPKPLSEQEINRILGVKQGEEGGARGINFIVGSRIRIIDGPFKGFEGVIEKIIEDKEKLVASVTVFGRLTPVELSFSQVEPLD
ncbi:MAG: transcription termination/antitermination protein NusG [Candidatus Cloacimonadia bacterium]